MRRFWEQGTTPSFPRTYLNFAGRTNKAVQSPGPMDQIPLPHGPHISICGKGITNSQDPGPFLSFLEARTTSVVQLQESMQTAWDSETARSLFLISSPYTSGSRHCLSAQHTVGLA